MCLENWGNTELSFTTQQRDSTCQQNSPTFCHTRHPYPVPLHQYCPTKEQYCHLLNFDEISKTEPLNVALVVSLSRRQATAGSNHAKEVRYIIHDFSFWCKKNFPLVFSVQELSDTATSILFRVCSRILVYSESTLLPCHLHLFLNRVSKKSFNASSTLITIYYYSTLFCLFRIFIHHCPYS